MNKTIEQIKAEGADYIGAIRDFIDTMEYDTVNVHEGKSLMRWIDGMKEAFDALEKRIPKQG